MSGGRERTNRQLRTGRRTHCSRRKPQGRAGGKGVYRQPDFSSTLYSQVGFADWQLATIDIGNGEHRSAKRKAPMRRSARFAVSHWCSPTSGKETSDGRMPGGTMSAEHAPLRRTCSPMPGSKRRLPPGSISGNGISLCQGVGGRGLRIVDHGAVGDDGEACFLEAGRRR